MKELGLILILTLSLFAQEVSVSKPKVSNSTKISAKSSNENRLQVSAKSFSSDDNTRVTTLKDNVVIKRGEDILYADVVHISTDKSRRPIEYTALGNVRFQARTEDGRKFSGSAKKIVYNVLKSEYRLYENANIKEDGTPNAISGEFILLNNKVGKAYSEGSKEKPTTLIFELD